MSKSITIQQGGVATSLDDIDKIRTNELGGGSCTWVPEDGTVQGSLTVEANGTYTASDDGYHSYRSVYVNVPGTSYDGSYHVVGTWEDGNDYDFSVDGETGELSMTKLPSSIVITTPPRKTEYVEGDEIDYSGIVVKAYYGDGGLYDVEDYPGGVIPFDELVFPKKYADKTSSVSIVSDNASLADGVINAGVGSGRVYYEVFYFIHGWNITEGRERAVSVRGGFTTVLTHGSSVIILSATSDPDATFVASYIFESDRDTPASGEGELRVDTYRAGDCSSHAKDGKTVYLFDHGDLINYNSYRYVDGSMTGGPFTPTTSGSSEGTLKDIAWSMVYGDERTYADAVPVQWTKPGGWTLSTSFPITVEDDGFTSSGGGDF